MIHIKRGRLPAGARAVALREDGRIVVYVSEDLSARQRLAAIREALRAAPAAGWRPERSPVLLPALALCAGLRQAPEGRWSYRMMTVALAGAALLITAATLTTISVQHGGVYQPAAAGPGRPPLTGAGPATSQSATGRGPGAAAAGERLLARAAGNGAEAGEGHHDLGGRAGAPGVGDACPSADLGADLGANLGLDLGSVAAAVPGRSAEPVAEPVAKPGSAVGRLGQLRRRARHHALPVARQAASDRRRRPRSGSRSASPRRRRAAAARPGRRRTRAAPGRSRSRRPCQRRGTARARPART